MSDDGKAIELVAARPLRLFPAWLARLPARSVSNVRTSFGKMRHRAHVRPAVYSTFAWPFVLLLGVFLVPCSIYLLDTPLDALRGNWPPIVWQLADLMTHIGKSVWYIVPGAIGMIAVNLVDWSGRRRRTLLILYNWTSLSTFVVVAMSGPGLLTTAVKHVVGRARPYLFDESHIFNADFTSLTSEFASFPSGHATTLGSLIGIATLISPRLGAVALALGLPLSFTRIVVGAHYTSDVIAGLALGFAGSVLTACVMARLGYLFRLAPDGRPMLKRTAFILW